VSFCASFVSEGQINQQLTVIVRQVMTERNASLLFSVELDNDHCDDLLTVDEKRGYVSSELSFL
jgi:hypothetical protein